MKGARRRERYVYIKNWAYYQHGHKRGYPWFKVYHELLHNDRFLRLTLAERGLFQCLLMCASESGDGRVSADSTLLARRLNVRRVSLEPLIHAGFIEVCASKAPSSRQQSATTDRESLLRKDRTRASASQPQAAGVARDKEEPPPNGWNGAKEARDQLMELVRGKEIA